MTEAARILGSRVRERRQARGLSVADLGDAVGISGEWIRRIERGTGRPSLETIEDISHALGIPIVALFAGDDAGGRFERLRLITDKLSEDEMAWFLEIGDVLTRNPQKRPRKMGNV